MDGRRSFMAAFGIALLILLALGDVTNSTAEGQQWLVEGNQSSAQLGEVVAPAGDVNGDGFSDQ